MKAAVVSSFGTTLRYSEFPDPVPKHEHEMVVDVLAAGLHPRVRAQADGSHYTSTEELPLVPGIDGVGRGPDGVLRYFALPDTTRGAMAERAVVDTRRSIVLPAGTDPIAVAASMNPATAAWIALRRRVQFRPGQNLVVFGATGSAGQMAVQIGKYLGANKIVAVGRGVDRLTALTGLGASEVVPLVEDADEVARRIGRAAADATWCSTSSGASPPRQRSARSRPPRPSE